MLLYYAFHSTVNQVRKFVRTWAFFLLLAIMLLGGFALYAARWYYQRLSEVDGALPEDLTELFTVSGLGMTDVVELVLGLVVLAILVLQLIGAEKSVSRLFMQADVNLLFTSPRSPQQNLAFRVASTMALAIAALPFMLLGVPSMMRSWGIGLYPALSVPLAWCLTLGFSGLLKVLAFELGSRHAFLRRNLRWLIFGGLALVGLVFYRAYDTSAARDLLATAQALFNAPWTRYVPVWGWVKGFVAFALEGRVAASLGLLGLSVALMGLLAWLCARVPADYYEETLGWAEEVARFRTELANDNAQLVVLGFAQRHRRGHAEGFRHGWGASVYFFKVLHQRRRFARWGFVTKTMLTYCFVALAAGLFVRFFMDDPLPYVPALLLCAMVFFRTVISPVTEDIRKDSFLLLPEPIWAKLFFSLLGGSCNCALDVVVPLVIGSAAAGFAPWSGLVYLPVLVTADFFAAATGVFTDVSIPPSIGVSLKQVAQVLLLYVGLMFDGMVVTFGIGTGNEVVGFVLVCMLDLVIGATFLGLTGVWLYPHRGRPVEADVAANAGVASDAANAGVAADGANAGTADAVPSASNLAQTAPATAAVARRSYTRTGLALAAMLVAIRGGQLLLAGRVDPFVALYLPIYGFGPLAFVALAGRGGVRPADHALPLRHLLALLPACLCAAYAGNIVGLVLQSLLRRVVPVSLVPTVGVLPEGHMALQFAFVTVASPLMEELVFRRCLLDRLRPYGEGAALWVSALAFGLFHGTASQLVYGLCLGVVFGYVYLRTGRLRYSVLLHVAINLLSSAVLPALLAWAASSVPGGDPRSVTLVQAIAEPGVLTLVAYLALLLVLALFGLVVLAFGLRECHVAPGGIPLRAALGSGGMLAFLLLSLVFLL